MVPNATPARVATSRIWTASYPPSEASSSAASSTRVRRATCLAVRCPPAAAVAMRLRERSAQPAQDLFRLADDARHQIGARREIVDQPDHLPARHHTDV